MWGLAGSEFFYDDEVDICSGCNQLERKASVKSKNLIYIFFTEVLKLILHANPFVKIFIEIVIILKTMLVRLHLFILV